MQTIATTVNHYMGAIKFPVF